LADQLDRRVRCGEGLAQALCAFDFLLGLIEQGRKLAIGFLPQILICDLEHCLLLVWSRPTWAALEKRKGAMLKERICSDRNERGEGLRIKPCA
jgi:hypothetical protein